MLNLLLSTLRNNICCALLQTAALLNSKTWSLLRLRSLSQSECIKKQLTPTHVDQTNWIKIYLTHTTKNPNIIETQRVGASTVKQHYKAVRLYCYHREKNQNVLKIRLKTKTTRPQSKEVESNTMFKWVHANIMLSEKMFLKKNLSGSRRWWNLSIPVVLSHCSMDSHFPFWGQTQVLASSLPLGLSFHLYLCVFYKYIAYIYNNNNTTTPGDRPLR